MTIKPLEHADEAAPSEAAEPAPPRPGERVNTDVTVVIPCYDEGRWAGLTTAIASVRTQVPAPAAILVVVDHNEALYERIRRELPEVTPLRNEFRRGVSGNRNTGAFAATTPLVAFVDDDITAHPGWLAELTKPLDDPGVVGCGGAITPVWDRRPSWVPDEFLWAYGGSFAGMPTETTAVRNVWSASMVVRRAAFVEAGGFRTDFGKVGDRSRPEDTEMCVRVANQTGGLWIYVPTAVIGHAVPSRHSTVRYFLTRCYNEGRGKIAMSRLLAQHGSLSSERDYLRSLPQAVGRGLAATVRGRDSSGAARAIAVVAGVAAAGFGGVVELSRSRQPKATS